MFSLKQIRKEAPIMPFVPVTSESKFLNPHSVVLIKEIEYAKKSILCECEEEELVFMFVQKELPFVAGEYALVQQKYNSSGENVVKIKDAADSKTRWQDGKSYKPSFPEAIRVALLQVAVQA